LYTGALVDPPALFEPLFLRGQLLLAEGRRDEAIAALTQAADGWRAAKSHPRRLKQAEQLIEKARGGS
jgi:hypothetical protein